MSRIILVLFLLVALVVIESEASCRRVCIPYRTCRIICRIRRGTSEVLQSPKEYAFQEDNQQELEKRLEDDINENNEEIEDDDNGDEEVEKRYFSDDFEERDARAADEYAYNLERFI